MGGKIVGGRASRGCDQGAVGRKLCHSLLAVDHDPQLGRLRALPQKRDFIDGKLDGRGSVDTGRAHLERVDDLFHSRVQPLRQTFLPVAGMGQAVFTIQVQVTPLARALTLPGQAAKVHAALASMSDAVLAYRGLTQARAPLLRWLARQAGP